MSSKLRHSVAAERLCRASVRQFVNPYTVIDWPQALEPDAWLMSPCLLSLAGSARFEAMGAAQQRRLAACELSNFFSINIHGEKQLVAGVAARLHTQAHGSVSDYLMHFLDEEARHMVWFGTFCGRYGTLYPEKKIPLTPVNSSAQARGEADVIFFARVLLFEALVDHYNGVMAQDESLPAVVREINGRHHRDEARHLHFGRAYLAQLAEAACPEWDPAAVTRVRRYLDSYVTGLWSDLANADVYRDAGIEDPFDCAREARARLTARRAWLADTLGFLAGLGLLEPSASSEEPSASSEEPSASSEEPSASSVQGAA
jgi:hypothetical protein